MKLLDLYCGAGGAAMGYHRAGFDKIVGVDIVPQKRYPFDFVLGDALEYCALHGAEFDLVVSSPPCQLYSVTSNLSNGNHPDLVRPTREALQVTGRPYVIENVPGAPLINPILICGTMFPKLRVIRHRLFECSPTIWFPPAPCQHIGKTAPMFWGDLVKSGHLGGSQLDRWERIVVTGHNFIVSDGQIAMDILWMTQKELSQAIPPAYTEWLGKEILKLI